jgi:hypothetical protein
MSDDQRLLEAVAGVSRAAVESDNIHNAMNRLGVNNESAAVLPREKRKAPLAETEDLAQAVYDGDFDAWLNAQKKRWRRVRRARNTVRQLLAVARQQHERVPALEQLGEGLVRSAMLAQYERDLAKPPVMTAATREVIDLDED